MNGIIIVDKPAGWTSHDIVAKLRGALKTKRVGHGGTLDPMATGVLPIFVGRATRAAEFCENSEKEYVAGIKFGIVTDTQDTTGKTLSTCDSAVSMEELLAVIPHFLHAQKQIPPMYSAIKIGGKKLYELARRGEEVERPARDIFISEIEVLGEAWTGAGGRPYRLAQGGSADVLSSDSPIASCLLRVVCSKGTYIRTLCNDIGAALGCGAAMSQLRRGRVGEFSLDMAHTLDEVLEAAASGDFCSVFLPVDTLFSKYPAIVLDEAGTQKCRNGALCHMAGVADGKCRVYGYDGEFLAFGEASNCDVRTVKSFFEVGGVAAAKKGGDTGLPIVQGEANRPFASAKRRVIALGFFDGMHLGHSALMKKVREAGRAKGLTPSAIIFDAHPANVARGTAIALINSPVDKTWLIRRRFGIDDTVFLHFDKATSQIPWDKFIEYLADELGARHLVAGVDFKFGKERVGNRELLERKCKQMGIGCDIIPEVNYDGAAVSSTQIRSLIASGDIGRANALLGHPHILSDIVRKGYRLGSKLGKPTINMRFGDGVLVPAHGVYATKVFIDEGEHFAHCFCNTELDGNKPNSAKYSALNACVFGALGVTNIGERPTVDDSGEITAETHILNFSGNLYGRRVRVEFHEFLRPEFKFNGVEELKAQIQRDCEAAMQAFDNAQGH